MSGTPNVSVPKPVKAAAKVQDAVKKVAAKKNPDPKPAKKADPKPATKPAAKKESKVTIQTPPKKTESKKPAKKDSGSDERAKIMEKARKGGYQKLSPSDLAKLTPGQKDKLGIPKSYLGNNQFDQSKVGTGGGQWTPPPGDTSGGTDFSTMPVQGGKIVEDPNGNPVLAPVEDPRPDIGPTMPGYFGPGPGTDPNTPAPVAPPPAPRPEFNGAAPDSFYTQAMQNLADNRARALASATEGERTLANDYGLGITQDDTGAKFTGTWAGSDANMGGIDPSNPFSRASLLNKSYFTAKKVGEGAYANRGLLTSGAYQRSQGRDAFGFESGKDQLLKQFASGLQDYRDRRSQAQSNYAGQSLQASLDLFNRNRDNYDRMYPS